MNRHESIRGYFAYYLDQEMKKDKSIRVITGDLGFGMLDNIRDNHRSRFINVGSAEQSAVGIAVGMALEGLKPFVYSITPFILYRAMETTKLYLNHEKIPVRLIGSGLDDDYKHDGASHKVTTKELEETMHILPNIKLYVPRSKEVVKDIVHDLVTKNEPSIIILRR